MEYKFKPILFSTEMVQAILDGRKTQTRRITVDWDQHKPKYIISGQGMYARKYPKPSVYMAHFKYPESGTDDCGLVAPLQPGDILWVRESFQYSDDLEEPFWYKQKYKEDFLPEYFERQTWRPSIHMPKEAARIFLKITNVRCERLQDISDNDCLSEGIELKQILEGIQHYKFYGAKYLTISVDSPNRSFKTLWELINGEKSWIKNPWVWVYTFEKVEKPENFPS